MGHAEYALTMNRPADPPFVLVAGAASRDITTADPRGWRLGGAVTYGSLTLARLGLRVGVIVGVDAEASRAPELDAIEVAGAIVIRVPLASGPVFEITERPAGRRLVCRSTSDPISGFSIPRAWLVQGTPAFLGPVAGELGPEWAAVGGGELALGWQGLLRSLRAGADVDRRPPTPNPLLDVATLVGLSREDVDERVAMSDLAGLLRPGATLVRTDGDRGGEVLAVAADAAPGTSWRYEAVPPDHIVDPTGAGDVFLAAMLAARIDPSLGPEVPVAAAAASLVIEASGVAGVPTRDAVRARMRRDESLASR
jgi:hypothetical protein